MIRRELKVSGEPDCWVLFRQAHHAVFAGLIAEGWQSPRFTPLEPANEVFAAINLHDDGWNRWDEQPQVDRLHGRPIAFNEMPLQDSLRIWQDSINGGRMHGPLQAFAIAGHFERLLLQFSSWRSEPSTEQRAEQFLAFAEKTMAQCLFEWVAESAGNTPSIAQRAIQFVRLFDALSLWFLCAERSEPATFFTPDGPAVTFTPLMRQTIIVDPWPFTIERYPLSAVGTVIPVKHYRSSEELRSEASHEIKFSWVLEPHRGWS